ncbi:MAG: transporter substrate-binding domain-containing protein [Lachnospiraceae bacterium]|nr:transporter substrate-binding domain-containing protein [Lachnospiraceae bacterium]
MQQTRRKDMKKLVALVLLLIMAASVLTGCGAKEPTTAKVIEIELTNEEYAFGVDKTQPELLKQVNAFIKQIKEDGTFEEICTRYFGDGTPVPVTSAALDTNKDQLVVATNAAFEPFEFTGGGDSNTYLGIDMEIAALLAKHLNKELVIQNMDFDAVCLAVGQQKCDIAMAGLTINEERKEYVTFSDSYYTASQKLIVPSTNTEFDNCADAASIEAILNQKDKSSKVGVQNGTTGQFYSEGDEGWGFAGFPVTTVGYKNGSLAVQDLLNGNINYVIIDSAPAAFITESINALQK